MTTENLLLFIDSLMSGGAQRQIIVLANALHERGYRVTLLTYYPGNQLGPLLASPAIRHDHVPRHSKYDVAYLIRLYRYLRKQRPDCIISFLPTPNFWARVAGSAAGCRRIITSERNINLEHHRWGALVERLLAPLSSAIVVNSHEGCRRLVHLGIPVRKLEVIYNGVDFEHFSEKPPTAVSALRDSLGVKKDEELILLPGRIEEQKNHILLVESILGLRLRDKKLKIAFAGNEFSSAIKRTIEELTRNADKSMRFEFLGPRTDMPLLYNAADLVVLPSLWEGFPNVAVEAMACCTPVVISDVSDNALIVDNGVTGYVFPNNDVEALSASIRTFLGLSETRRREMGRRARQRAEALCSIDRLANRYIALIEQNRPDETATN